jgi:predicted negative regulator of RcsB-dependent stress response
MLRTSLYLAGLVLTVLTPRLLIADEPLDPFFGEAVYHARQGNWFDALERLDTEVLQHRDVDEAQLDSLYAHVDAAEFSLGDFELRYRMHHRAGRAITAVLEGAVDERIRNDAAYRLARIHFQKQQMEDALLALDRIDGDIPKDIRDDIEFLRANVYLAQGRPLDAVPVLEGLQKSDEYSGYAAYNLGIAWLEDGQRAKALEQLDIAGTVNSNEPGDLAIRDKANLVLGTIYLDDEEFERAATILNRVSLEGPYSNQALLSAGWANMSRENYERALVPWGILAEREVTDAATQEALLALPYAYGKLNIHGRAAVHYGRALDAFGNENKDWLIRLRSLPEAPETYYLMELLASHDFQTGLQNYLDLADLKRRLLSWESGFDSYDEMVDIRRTHYEPLLPDIDEAFRKLDSRMRLRQEQHGMLVKRRNDLLTTPRPEFLATRDEQAVIARLDLLEAQATGQELERVQRLRGVLAYTLHIEYHERFTEFDRNLRNLDEAMVTLHREYDEFVRSRQAATHSYEGYDQPMQRLRADVQQSVDKIDMLMARQGRLLEVLAIDQLIARRDHLENYGDKARFALADSYDRATQAQARLEGAE